MKRLSAIVAAIAIVGCGGAQDSKSLIDDGNGGPGVGPAVATIAMPVSATDSVKVVLNKASVVVTESPYGRPNGQFDPETGDPLTDPVPCTQAGTECAPYTGTICGSSLVCVFRNSSIVENVMYVKNQAGADGIPVPCAAPGATTPETYTALVLARADAASAIREIQQTKTFTVDAACNVEDVANPNLNYVDWDPIALPALVAPPIYVGLPAPQDKYQLTLQNFSDKVFSRSEMALQENTSFSCSNDRTRICSSATTDCAAGTGVTCVAGLKPANLTFAAPRDPARTADLTFTANFTLNRRLLLVNEAPASWFFAITNQAVTPVPNAIISVLP